MDVIADDIRLRGSPSDSLDPSPGLHATDLSPRWRRDAASGLGHQLVNVLPVHQVIEERLQVIRTPIAVVDVIGMLPDVAAQDRGGAMHQRTFAVRGFRNLKLAVFD